MAATIELPWHIDRDTVERAYREGKRAQALGSQRYTVVGRRAAKARDPKLLLALQKGAAVLQRMSEEQAGQHGFDIGGRHVEATEFQLWKNAYTAVDAGNASAEGQYMHIWGMGAILAGLV